MRNQYTQSWLDGDIELMKTVLDSAASKEEKKELLENYLNYLANCNYNNNPDQPITINNQSEKTIKAFLKAAKKLGAMAGLDKSTPQAISTFLKAFKNQSTLVIYQHDCPESLSKVRQETLDKCNKTINSQMISNNQQLINDAFFSISKIHDLKFVFEKEIAKKEQELKTIKNPSLLTRLFKSRTKLEHEETQKQAEQSNIQSQVNRPDEKLRALKELNDAFDKLSTNGNIAGKNKLSEQQLAKIQDLITGLKLKDGHFATANITNGYRKDTIDGQKELNRLAEHIHDKQLIGNIRIIDASLFPTEGQQKINSAYDKAQKSTPPIIPARPSVKAVKDLIARQVALKPPVAPRPKPVQTGSTHTERAQAGDKTQQGRHIT